MNSKWELIGTYLKVVLKSTLLIHGFLVQSPFENDKDAITNLDDHS